MSVSASARSLLSATVLLLLAATASAQSPALPFTGARSFNFEAGAGSEQIVRIDAKGHTTITMVGHDASVKLYEGPYQNPLPVRGERGEVVAYYRIDDAQTVSLLDENKQPQTGCQMGAGTPCRSGLYPAD